VLDKPHRQITIIVPPPPSSLKTKLNVRTSLWKIPAWIRHWHTYCFTSRSIIFHLYGDVTIAGEGLQNLGLCSALTAFKQGRIFIVPHLLWRGTSVFPVSSEGPPHSVASYATWGCGGPSILTRILTGVWKLWLLIADHRYMYGWRTRLVCVFLIL
jgi:hypothetical protein